MEKWRQVDYKMKIKPIPHKSREDRFKHAASHMSQALEIMGGNSFLLMVYRNKPSIELEFFESCANDIALILKVSAETILKKPLYIYQLPMEGRKKKNEKRLLISKNKLNIKKWNNEIIGLELGIPNCCVKKYCEEDDGSGNSNNSAIRYLEQLKKKRIKKDPFEVHVSNIGAMTSYGFIPCSPTCKKAVKIHEDFINLYNKLK